jgi:hypothetical protein
MRVDMTKESRIGKSSYIELELDTATYRRLKKYARKAGLSTDEYLKSLLEGFVNAKSG